MNPSETEAANLKKFADDGYFILSIDLSAEDATAIDRDVDRLWRERPANISFAYDSPPLRFSEADERAQRRPRYRIHELHSFSDVALRLYLDPILHRYATFLLGETAVASQSLYFEFGSQQALHRDSTVVPTPEFGQLVAAWIALEDIAPESGPLMYVPRSHRFPFYEFSPGRALLDPTKDDPKAIEAAINFYNATLEESGLPTKHFLGRRGEVLIWHSALMHGGAPPVNASHTRKSFVIHYSALRTQKTRESAVREVVDGATMESVFTTDRILERDGARGFANPLDGRLFYRR